MASEFGLSNPFWETSLRKDIYEYKTTSLPDVTPPQETRFVTNEEIIAPIQETLVRLCGMGIT